MNKFLSFLVGVAVMQGLASAEPPCPIQAQIGSVVSGTNYLIQLD